MRRPATPGKTPLQCDRAGQKPLRRAVRQEGRVRAVLCIFARVVHAAMEDCLRFPRRATFLVRRSECEEQAQVAATVRTARRGRQCCVDLPVGSKVHGQAGVKLETQAAGFGLRQRARRSQRKLCDQFGGKRRGEGGYIAPTALGARTRPDLQLYRAYGAPELFSIFDLQTR